MNSKTKSKPQIYVALDIGTTKVCTIIASVLDEKIDILGVGSHPSYGLKKGCVVNIEQTVKSIRCSLEEAKLMSGLNSIEKATIGIAGNHIYSFNSSGVVATKNKEVTEDDVNRVLDAAKAVVIPSDREILHALAQEFRVDNTGGIKDPVGMFGVRLEVHVHVVTGQTTLIQNLVKCVDQAGIQTRDIILQPVASSRSVLSEEEKELGVVLVDIGGGTTDIAIWKDGCLVCSQIIPVGGSHFTNDLAVALKITHNEAERIKINHGSIIPEKTHDNQITVQGLSGRKAREVDCKYIAKILGARAEELLKVVKNVMLSSGYQESINAGFVITGGGALIKDLIPFSEFTLESPVRLGYPVSFGGMTNVMQDPKLSTVLGLLLESIENANGENMEVQETSMVEEVGEDVISRFSRSLKNVFREIF